MPKPHEFLSAEQRDGSTLQAEEIYKRNLGVAKENRLRRNLWSILSAIRN